MVSFMAGFLASWCLILLAGFSAVLSAPQQLPDIGGDQWSLGGVTGFPGELPSMPTGIPGGDGLSWDSIQNQTSGGLPGAPSGDLPSFTGGLPGASGDLPSFTGGLPGASGDLPSWDTIQNQTSAVGVPGSTGELPTFSGAPSWDSLQNQTTGGLPGASGDFPDFSSGIPGQEGGNGFPGVDQWDSIRNQTGNRVELPGGGTIPGADGFGNFSDMQNQTLPGMNVGTGYLDQLQNQTVPGNFNQGCASGLGSGDN